MGKFSGVLLATDYDDTLYGTNFTISPENRAAIRYFVSEGGHFTVSTGRSYLNFAIQMERESLPINTPVILSNGANIYDFSKNIMLYATHLRPEANHDLFEACNRFPDLGFEGYCKERVYIHNPNEVTRRHLDRAGLEGIPLPILDMPAPFTKAILQHTNHGLLQDVQRYMRTRWHEHYEIIFSNAVLLEMTAKGSHKGSAVLWLANFLNVRRKHIYCIGNGHNDIPMLDISAEPFAPSNCAQAVREQGATILTSCDESCIARLIEMLDRRYSKKRPDSSTD